MLTIKQTTDAELISKICNHPQVFDWISDDCTLKPFVPVLDGLIHLTDDAGLGVITIQPWNGITCQVHMACLPEMWGRGHKMVKDALYWGFKNTRFSKVLGIVPEYNSFIRKLLSDLNFTKDGIITESWLKNFKKYDQIIYSTSKMDFLREK